MAVTDPASIQHVDQRLRALLVRAKEIKPIENIEPPLPASAFIGENGLPTYAHISKASHSTAVEIVARRIFQAQAASAESLDKDFGIIWHLLDLLQILGDQDQCEPSILWYIVEELLDSRSIEGCRIIFDYLESRRERLVAKSFKKVNLVILRACNELLRRLSRAEDAVFCGRVFIFVFQSFPLGDKSSVNRHGDYNIDNVTTTDSGEPTTLEGPDQDTNMTGTQEIFDEATLDNKSQPNMALDELHPKFWALQKTFANPPTVFDANSLADFKTVFQSTLARFNSVAKVSSAPVVENKHGLKRKAGDLDHDEFANHFNPKYLTSRELFELELSDLSFQRHVLVQAMILLEFLLSFTEKAKLKQHARTQQKYQFTLSDDDTEWVYQTKKAIISSLREGHDGAAFVRMVETVLSRDKNWVRWKEINCPEILLPALDPKEYVRAAKGARSVSAWRRLQTAGSLDLKFLNQSEQQSGIKSFSVHDRRLTPSTETLVNAVETAELDLEMAFSPEEVQSLQQLKASNTWRALRVACVDKLSKFDKIGGEKDLKVLLDRPNDPDHQAPPADNDDTQNSKAVSNEAHDLDESREPDKGHSDNIAVPISASKTSQSVLQPTS